MRYSSSAYGSDTGNNKQRATPPRSAIISRQPTPTPPGNVTSEERIPQRTEDPPETPHTTPGSVTSEERTPQRTEDPPETPQTTPGDSDNQSEKTPQRTESNEEQPLETAGSVTSEERIPQRTEDPPETPQTTPGDSDNQSEKTPQRTESNEEQPLETAGDSTDGKSSSFEAKMQQILGAMRRKPLRQVNVGIFTRSAKSDYEWLKTRLESEFSVRPCYISNNGYREFSNNVSWCNVGILYHTQNRGRVNLTDVTDALYDEEIQELSRRLEKKNVIVVIDDLKDSGEERRNQILEGQPKLRDLAAEVILFSGDEKKEGKEGKEGSCDK
ncbi:uncharacterized protein LOC142245709 isoform X1 [Anomaloglossus baeobatrachus]|uniref:uncharacterized protein LOC142245709 isoform X1 n=1 Tax=Anomaloglossus baeobatrachus TaxID=238106 RepID=UPI003F502BC4